ncbi:MarR family winged helix-turn-helix transcriptional regulator [Thermodesulfobacteriota bacterium]
MYTLFRMFSIKSDTINEIHKRFYSVVGLAEKLEKTPRSYGTDELLTSSEIHVIEIIGQNDGKCSVTDIAKFLGVTKGAVSQKLKKLENKELTIKHEDPQNISRSIIKLKTKGKAAFYAHKLWHETMDGGFIDYYQNLEEDKIAFLLDFVTKLEDFLKRAVASGK